MKNRYKTGKFIVKASGIIFVSAFVVAIASENTDFSVNMILTSWFAFIAGAFMIAFSPEEKARVARKREERKVAIKKYQKEAKQKEKNKAAEYPATDKGSKFLRNMGIFALIAFPFMVLKEIAKKYD